MKIFVLRHGRTELNRKGIFNGQVDEPLNDEGREQAAGASERLAAALKAEGSTLSAIYCSPLSRTWETCEIATAGLSAPVILEPRLMERTLGTLDGRDLDMGGFDSRELFNYHYDPALPGGFESWAAVLARVGEFIDELVAESGDSDRSVLLVAHGGSLRGVYYHFFPLPADGNLVEPRMENCALAVYEITPGSHHVTYRLLA